MGNKSSECIEIIRDGFRMDFEGLARIYFAFRNKLTGDRYDITIDFGGEEDIIIKYAGCSDKSRE